MEIFGYLSALCFSLCYVPQIIKTHRLKKVDDISIWLFILSCVAYLFGLVYGYYLNKFPLILNYSIGFCLSWIIVIQWTVYRDPKKYGVRNIVSKEIKNMKEKFQS